MSDMDYTITPTNKDGSSDEKTEFMRGDGTSPKRRRRKSQGRRVSFAETLERKHIFPRDDEYQTPSPKGEGAARSPSKGSRRSPRLAAKVLDPDKENRVITSSGPASSQRGKKKGKVPLAERPTSRSPASKPQNWLDPREISSFEPGDDDENTGPVDLRHLSFDQVDLDEDDDNVTLDSTAFALKLSQQEISMISFAANPGKMEPSSKGSPGDTTFPESDMSLTRNLRLQRPPVELQTAIAEISSNMSITMQLFARQKKVSSHQDSESSVNFGAGGDTDAMDMIMSPASAEDHPQDQSIPLSIPSLGDLIRGEKEEAGKERGPAPGVSLVHPPFLNNQARQASAKNLPSLGDLIREEREHAEMDRAAARIIRETHDVIEDKDGLPDDVLRGIEEARKNILIVDDKETGVEGENLTVSRWASDVQSTKTGMTVSDTTAEDWEARSSSEMENTSIVDGKARMQEDGEACSPAQEADTSPMKKVMIKLPRTKDLNNLPQDASVDMTDGGLTEKLETIKAIPVPPETATAAGSPTGDFTSVIGQQARKRSDEVSDEADFEAQESKRTKFGRDDISPSAMLQDTENMTTSFKFAFPSSARDWTCEDTTGDSMQGPVTSQIPRFSDLLAADADSAHSTPAEVDYIGHIRGVSVRAAYGDEPIVLVANPDDAGDDPNTERTSAFDCSMDIADTTVYPNPSPEVNSEQKAAGMMAFRDDLSSPFAKEKLINSLDVEATEGGEDVLTSPTQGITIQVKEGHWQEVDNDQDSHGTVSEPNRRTLGTAQMTEVTNNDLSTPDHGFAFGLHGLEPPQENRTATIDLTATEVVDPAQNFVFDSHVQQEASEEAAIFSSRKQLARSPPQAKVQTSDSRQEDAAVLRQDRTGSPQGRIARFEEREELPAFTDNTQALPGLSKDYQDHIISKEPNFQAPDTTTNYSQDGVGDSSSIQEMEVSVEDFLELVGIEFTPDTRNLKEVLNDPSFAETYELRSLHECLAFEYLRRPQIDVFRDACDDLYEDNLNSVDSVANLEKQMTANSPAIIKYFLKAPKSSQQQIRQQIQRYWQEIRLLTEKAGPQIELKLEENLNRTSLEANRIIQSQVQQFQEMRKYFDQQCREPRRLLEAHLTRKVAEKARASKSSLLKATDSLETSQQAIVLEERLESLKKQMETKRSSIELRLTTLRGRKQALQDRWTDLSRTAQLRKGNLSALRNQAVDNLCSGQKNLSREAVSLEPYDYAIKMKHRVLLVNALQDGFHVKSNGAEGPDPIIELGYRSLLKRRYVVRKVDGTPRVISSFWELEPAEIHEMFPESNPVDAFRLMMANAVSTSNSANMGFWPAETIGTSMQKDFKYSMQVTRRVVGNLVSLLNEVEKCEVVVNDSCGGGVMVAPRFVNEADVRPHLELKVIDSRMSIKFLVKFDMTCLPLTGYPVESLGAELEVAFVARRFRHLFQKDVLEKTLAGVTSRYQKIVRTCEGIGAVLASLRRRAGDELIPFNKEIPFLGLSVSSFYKELTDWLPDVAAGNPK